MARKHMQLTEVKCIQGDEHFSVQKLFVWTSLRMCSYLLGFTYNSFREVKFKSLYYIRQTFTSVVIWMST